MTTIFESDVCSYSSKCKFFKKNICKKIHPCHYYPKCTNPNCIYDHVFVQKNCCINNTQFKSISNTELSNSKLSNSELPKSSILSPYASIFVPKYHLNYNKNIDTTLYYGFKDIDEDHDNIDDCDNFEENSDDEETHILFDGTFYLYDGHKYVSYDDAYNKKCKDDDEYYEISKMIIDSLNEKIL